MSEAKPLSADDILATDDQELVQVVVPEWKDISVWVRTVSAEEGSPIQDEIAAAQVSKNPGAMNKARMNLLAATIVDAAGNRLFNTPEQIVGLGKKQIKVLERLTQISMRLQAWTVETAAKNASGGAAPAASPTA